MYPSTDVFAHQLNDALGFPSTIQGNRQRRTWQRLINHIESSASLSAFDKAAAYAEGYAHALVDTGQISVSTKRDLLIITTVDAWRCTRTAPNTSTYL